MKHLIYFFTLSLLTVLISGSLKAQSTDRFNRDIRIAEGIIEELFESDSSTNPFGNRYIRDVSGRYIPGYGIHFRIGANLTPSILRIVLEEQTEIQINGDSDSEELRELGRDFVEQRFMEYLKNYAPLFKDLPDNEVIRLTIGPTLRAAGLFISAPAISLMPGNADTRRRVANITAWATASDIRAFDDNSISESLFESRVEIVDLADQETERDQTVFASILQTSLEEVSDTIRVRLEPVAEYLPGLGLSYRVNASLRSGNWFDFGDIEIQELKIETDSLFIDLSKVLEEIDFDEIGRIAERVDSAMASGAPRIDSDSIGRSFREIRESVSKQGEQLSGETVRELVDQFHAALNQTVQDYGSTLRSLDNDEMLLITINWSGRHPALPARTELRIRKSDILDNNEPILEVIRL